MRRRASVEIGAILTAVVTQPAHDNVDGRILDATESVLREAGLRGWSLEDVADRADVGRTSIYRRFGDRDNLVHAVLARELRTTLRRIGVAIEPLGDLEDKVVAAVREALAALDESVVDDLLRSDPETFLPFLTTEAAPLLDVARSAIHAQLSEWSERPSLELAEAMARFGLSFVLTRSTILPLEDEVGLEQSLRLMVRPFLREAGQPAPEGCP